MFMNRFSRVRELKAQKESPTANIYNLLDLFQPLTQISFYCAYVFQHFILFNRLQCRRDRGHRNHAAPERRTEIILFDMLRDPVRYQAGTHWNATAERFRQCNDVGHNSITCFTAGEKPFARPPNSALPFLLNQHDPTPLPYLPPPHL